MGFQQGCGKVVSKLYKNLKNTVYLDENDEFFVVFAV